LIPYEGETAMSTYASLAPSIRRAIEITPESSASDRTIDITTIGRRTGLPRRIEIFFYRAGGQVYLSSLPAQRSWYANLEHHPRFTFHLKHRVRADLPAIATPVTDQAERRAIFTEIVADLNQPSNPGRISQPTSVDAWVHGSPLMRVSFDFDDDPASAVSGHGQNAS
jgi:deazaflavin-dependent oxidoreductase (nitroreductase family)